MKEKVNEFQAISLKNRGFDGDYSHYYDSLNYKHIELVEGKIPDETGHGKLDFMPAPTLDEALRWAFEKLRIEEASLKSLLLDRLLSEVSDYRLGHEEDDDPFWLEEADDDYYEED
jgi:hypothetical protein